MLLAERNIQPVVGGRCLQLEIERTAETFAQREAPGFVDTSAEGRMNHQLHAATFVEKAFGHHAGVRRHRAQSGPAGLDVFHGLFCAALVEPAFALQ